MSVTLCREGGWPAEKGMCPLHRGDACLVVLPILLNQLQRERDEARVASAKLLQLCDEQVAIVARLRSALVDANEDACDAQCYFQPDGSTLHTPRCDAAQAALAASPPETLAALRELMAAAENRRVLTPAGRSAVEQRALRQRLILVLDSPLLAWLVAR